MKVAGTPFLGWTGSWKSTVNQKKRLSHDELSLFASPRGKEKRFGRSCATFRFHYRAVDRYRRARFVSYVTNTAALSPRLHFACGHALKKAARSRGLSAFPRLTTPYQARFRSTGRGRNEHSSGHRRASSLDMKLMVKVVFKSSARTGCHIYESISPVGLPV
jgi:hypothetical protein